MGISMVQVALLESRFRGDSLHSGAWCLRLAAQAAGIRRAQNHCTGRAYSGPPKAAVRLTAQGGQILIERVDLCRMSQAVGPVSKTTNVWARVRISADL